MRRTFCFPRSHRKLCGQPPQPPRRPGAKRAQSASENASSRWARPGRNPPWRRQRLVVVLAQFDRRRPAVHRGPRRVAISEDRHLSAPPSRMQGVLSVLSAAASSMDRSDALTTVPIRLSPWSRGGVGARGLLFDKILRGMSGTRLESRNLGEIPGVRRVTFQSRTCLPETRQVGVLLGASQSRKKGFARSSFSFLASSAADRESHEFHETNFAERKKVRHHHHHHHHRRRFLQVRPSAFLAPWRTPSRGSASCRDVSRQPTRWSERRSRTERHEERRPMLPEGVRVLANDVHHDKQCCSTQPLTRATKNHEITQDDVS